MRILITGACGFVGAILARQFTQDPDVELVLLDNLSRQGSEQNREVLRAEGLAVVHGDLRCSSDVDGLPKVDWVIDAAANPSVLAGVDGGVGSRQVVEHNLGSTLNLLEKCRRDGAGFILLSTSRVYSIPPLASLPVDAYDDAFQLRANVALPPGVGPIGITEAFSTEPPLSLYGATKRTSELMALEYGAAFQFPVFINRCGVLAGAGQFGRADQGIFSYWLHSHRGRRPLRYLGFGGTGHQVRDCLHPADLVPLLRRQITVGHFHRGTRVFNVGGGAESARSLRQLTRWCDHEFGPHPVIEDGRPRPFDLPWVVLDCSLARTTWHWSPTRTAEDILSEIASHCAAHPDWLLRTSA